MGQGMNLIKDGLIKWLTIMGNGSARQGVTNVLDLIVETQKKYRREHNMDPTPQKTDANSYYSANEARKATTQPAHDMNQNRLERETLSSEQQRARELFDEISQYLSSRIPGTTTATHPEGNYTLETPANSHQNHIWIDVDEEITFGFSDWHTHFDFSEESVKLFYTLLNAVINNELCTACKYYMRDGHEYWGASTLLSEAKGELKKSNLYDEFGSYCRIVCSFWDASKDKEFNIMTGMTEITDDHFNAFLEICDDCVLDYCIMKSQECYTSLRLHKEAIGFALETCGRKYEMTFKMDIEKARAECIDAEDFLSVPNVPWFKKTAGGGGFIKEIVGEKLKYWFAFLEPPYGASPIIQNHKVIRRGLSVDDFHKMNQLLFPNGAESLTVYEWTTDWSDYFDDGHEWWGAACWSIYDKILKRYVVILASATD